MAYPRLTEHAVAVVSAFTSTGGATRAMTGWLMLEPILRDPGVQRSGMAALQELELLTDALGRAVEVRARREGGINLLEAGGHSDVTMAGLLLRLSADFGAMAVLSHAGSHQRMIAGQCRAVYEAVCWLDVVSDPEVGERAALIYRYEHERALAAIGRPIRDQILAALGTVKAANARSGIVELLPLRIEAHLRSTNRVIDGELESLAGEWFGVETTKSSKRNPRPPPRRTADKVNDELRPEVRDEMRAFWGAMIYDPACRLLHACDALDFVNADQLLGVAEVRAVPGFAGHAGDPETVVAATVLRTFLTLDQLGPMIVANSSAPPDVDASGLSEEGEFFDRAGQLLRVVTELAKGRWM